MSPRTEREPGFHRRLTDEAAGREAARADTFFKNPLGASYKILSRLFVFALSLTGFFGIFTYVIESDDRRAERDMREAELVDKAYGVLGELTDPKLSSVAMSPRLEWAMRILAEHGEVVQIKHPHIDLNGVRLACGVYSFVGHKVRLSEADVENAFVQVVGDEVEVENLAARKIDLYLWPTFGMKSIASLAGVARDSIFYVNVPAANLDLTATDSKLVVGPLLSLDLKRFHMPRLAMLFEGQPYEWRAELAKSLRAAPSDAIFTGTFEESGPLSFEPDDAVHKPTRSDALTPLYRKMCPGNTCDDPRVKAPESRRATHCSRDAEQKIGAAVARLSPPESLEAPPMDQP